MSVLGVSRLARDLEQVSGALARFEADPDGVLTGYPLEESERAAILSLDATSLLEAGVNPIVIRNLFVVRGVKHADLYQVDRDG